jgi:hypothetical protein
MPAILPTDPDNPPPLRQDGEVFILGAGFSKAICDQMPTLNELGHRISQPFQQTPSFALLTPAAVKALKAGNMPGGGFEAWLSYLAEPAPFLDESERLHNAAIARELVRLGVDEIETSEHQTLTRPMPYWLGRLVTLWDRLDSTVITFNYDTLVEQAVNARRLPWLYWPKYGGELRDAVALRLLKMHGSTNWWWIPSDKVGTTVQVAPLAGEWGQPHIPTRIRGMEHFVVPPLAVKSDYYDLSITRDAWQSARESLGTASRIILMGYSAPITDLTVAALLGNYADPDVPIIVVDPNAASVVKRLSLLGLRRAEPLDGDESIRQFTENYEVEVSQRVAPSLAHLLDSIQIGSQDPVVARIEHPFTEPHLPITEVRTTDDVTRLIATQWQSGQVLADMAVKSEPIRQAIGDAASAGRRLVLQIPGQPDRAVLNIAARVHNRNLLAIES